MSRAKSSRSITHSYARTRVKYDMNVAATPRVTTTTYWDGRTPLVNTVTRTALTGSQRMSDVVTPRFKECIKQGIMIENPMSSSATSHFAVFGDLTFVWNQRSNAGYYCTDHHTGILDGLDTPGAFPQIDGLPPNGVPQGTIDAAINAAYANAYSGTAQLLVDLLEAKETLGMLKAPLGAARELLKKSKKLRSSDARVQALIAKGKAFVPKKDKFGKRFPDRLTALDAIDLAGGLWLEWRYGWNPLMMSISDTLKGFNEEKTKSKRYTGRGSEAYHVAKTATRSAIWYPYTNGAITTTYTTDVVIDARVRAGVIVQGDASFAHSMGLEASAIPTAAWEIVPYSFVVDWFTRVGDYIQAHSPTPGFKKLTSWVTVQCERTTTLTCVTGPGSSSQGTGTSALSMTCSGQQNMYQYITRTKSRTFGVQPSVLPPIVDNGDIINTKHFIDGLALAYQRFR